MTLSKCGIGAKVTLNAINQYKLDTHIDDYPEGEFIPLSQETYNFFETFYGITPQFKNEIFYYPENNTFLGRESPNSLVAAINNIIYKIITLIALAPRM